MWLFIAPLLSLVALVTGITLIVKRQKKGWYLWTGIALIVLFLLSLPIVLPFLLLALLFISGGSFT